ncbi:hypothetical protein BU23DRAFT_568668 [Bimuria novae-zelandiae CBS 107.79]|uniref:Uncharacterized protein n=1 Tax=Bimuria novae-zelandiae CBS 107.79 TaxID=1447943 RepID=A0A6A5V6I4_9PLEO|nr:hypothetical protein BU23DRAFT_568668 [Bimuria novae-zelandiae CBS 107.79]
MDEPQHYNPILELSEALEMRPETWRQDRERLLQLIDRVDESEEEMGMNFVDACNAALEFIQLRVERVQEFRKIGNDADVNTVMETYRKTETKNKKAISEMVQQLVNVDLRAIDLEAMVRQYNRILARVHKNNLDPKVEVLGRIELVKKDHPERYPSSIRQHLDYIALLDNPVLEADAARLASLAENGTEDRKKEDGPGHGSVEMTN